MTLSILAVFGVGILLNATFVHYPTIGSGRVERPEHDFAITFPDDWTVRETLGVGPSYVGYLGIQAPLEGQTLVLVALTPTHRADLQDGCFVVVDDPPRRASDELLSPYADRVEVSFSTDESFDQVTRDHIDLSAGPAWRIDATGGGRSTSVYLIRGSAGIYRLQCTAPARPEGGWFPIADSFEFLSDDAKRPD